MDRLDDTDERILGALRAGAQGYLLKGASRDEIFSAIRTVAAGSAIAAAGARGIGTESPAPLREPQAGSRSTAAAAISSSAVRAFGNRIISPLA